MAPTVGRVARPEQRWGCSRSIPQQQWVSIRLCVCLHSHMSPAWTVSWELQTVLAVFSDFDQTHTLQNAEHYHNLNIRTDSNWSFILVLYSLLGILTILLSKKCWEYYILVAKLAC